MELNTKMIEKINQNFSLDKNEVDCALSCMRKSIKCYQNAPILSNEERNKYIKECQENVIKCYLQILLNKNK
jgi:hypothetical protein